MTGTTSEDDPPPQSPEQEGAHLGRGELQQRAIKGATWTLLHTLISIPVAFLVNILIARVLGTVDYGRLAYLSSVMEIVGGLVSMGVGVGLVQFGSKAHAVGRPRAVRDLLSKSQGFRLLIDLPVLTLVVLLIANVPPGMLALAVVFGVLAPAALSGAPASLGIENKTADAAKNALIMSLVTQLAVVVAALTIGTADSLWVTRLVLGGISVGTALIWVSPAYRRAVLRPKLPRNFPPGFWRFALPAAAASIVGSFVISRTEVLALTWADHKEAAGIYALAFGLSNHIFAPAQALIGPLVPAVSGLREVDADAVGPAFHRTIRGTATVVAGLVAVAVPTLAVLIPLIYGADFSGAGLAFLVLSVGGGFYVLAGPVQAFVQSRLASNELLRLYLIALVVNVGLMAALIPFFSLWGAVAANLVGALTALLLMLRGELRGLDVPWHAAASSAAPLGLGVLGAIAGYAAGSATGLPAIFGAAISAIIGAVTFLLGLRLARTGLSEGDRVAITSSLPARLRPSARRIMSLLTYSC